MFAILTLVFVVFGVPHLTVLKIFHESKANGGVHHPHVQDLLGWNFSSFRAPHHAWRIRRSYLSVAVCLAATMFDDPLVQIAIALVALIQTYANQMRAMPFIEPRINSLEITGLRFVALALLVGILRAERYRTPRTWPAPASF